MFTFTFVIALFGIASGTNVILYEKLMLCVRQPFSDLKYTFAQISRCADKTFRHCYQDTVTGTHPDMVSELHDPCGFIDSQKINFNKYLHARGHFFKHVWWIKSRQTVWIELLEFQLNFDDFPCYTEYMEINNGDTNNRYCGIREPWKYYSTKSEVFIIFVTDVQLTKLQCIQGDIRGDVDLLSIGYRYTRGIFQFYFQEGQRIRHNTHLYQAKLNDLKDINYEVTSIETRLFLYFITHRLQAIQLNISSCWSHTHLAVYDGPGVKSQQKHEGNNVTSTAFIMLLVIDINGLLIDCQKYPLVRYKSVPHNIGKCRIKKKSNKDVYVAISRQSCVWHVPSHLDIVKIDSYKRPETLLDGEMCIYGGIFIYSRVKNTKVREMGLICGQRVQMEHLDFFLKDDERVLIALIVFDSYSKIHGIISKAYASEDTRNTRVSICNSDQDCQASIDLDIGANSIFKNQYYVGLPSEAKVQYIGMSGVSTNIEFIQKRASAFAGYFTSSLCLTSPYFCSCVALQVKYSYPITYLLHEMQHPHEVVKKMPNTRFNIKDSNKINVAFASSVFVNMSACEQNNRTMWWILTFLLEFPRETDTFENTSYPLLLSPGKESWFKFDFDELAFYFNQSLDAFDGHRSWWIMIHIMQNKHKHESSDNYDMTKVCFHCLSCYDIQLKVEMLEQGKDESVVYTISNFEHIQSENHNSSDLYSYLQECRMGITCNECNVILTYTGNLPYRGQCAREHWCASPEIMLKRIISTKRQSLLMTSIKKIQIFKISNR